MVPSFIDDWQIGLKRFKESNPHFTEFDHLGMPVFAGWVFNGFDTARARRTASEIEAGVVKDKAMIQADSTMHDRVAKAVADELVGVLQSKISAYDAVAEGMPENFRIGDIEDANVLIQNSLWLNVPLGQLGGHQQVSSLYDRRQWATNQLEQIQLIGAKFDEMAAYVEKVCV